MPFDRPRRIAHSPPYGSMLKGASAAQARIPTQERNEDYLGLVRRLPCLKCGMEPSEAAHVRFASAAFGKSSGLSKKPEDRWALPLCSSCHRLARDAQHNRNEQEFWASIDISPLNVASQLYAQRGDFVAMEQVVRVAIMNRKVR